MRHWENYTCISFVSRQPHHVDYIFFTVDKCGCCSYVGRRGGGPQAISIGKNCDKFGIVVHELGHVIGFWHEHTRLDRDDHVVIFYKSIQHAQDYNFDKLKSDDVNSLNEPYDYASIMHYARDTFSKAVYLDTILPKVLVNGKRPEIGQRLQLSSGDISQANKLYQCPACGKTMLLEVGELRLEGPECIWRIVAAIGETVKINVSTTEWPPVGDCSLEGDNFVAVHDGSSLAAPTLGKLCGGASEVTYVSSSNRLTVRAKTSGLPLALPFAFYKMVCGGSIVSSSGTIQSPQFPENYGANLRCEWVITVPEGHQVALIFHYFNLEMHKDCVYDHLGIYDADSANDSLLISRFCGQVNTDSVVSSGNKIFLLFVSDGSVQKPGFHIEFLKELNECVLGLHDCEHQCINEIGGYRCACNIGYSLREDGRTCQSTCGGFIQATSGIFYSPNFPLEYPPLKECFWEIEADEGYQIIVNFTKFDVEGMKTECAYDYLSLMDEAGKEERYCGYYEEPLVYTSFSNRLKARFVTDSSVEKGGFSAYFITDLDECRENKGGCEQLCINTIGSYRCVCEAGYVLADDGHNCKEGGCHFQLHDPDGELTSPGYPLDYPNGKTCDWHIVTTPGHRLVVAFEEFELEEQRSCKYDHLKAFDGGDTNTRLLGIFCGSDLPPSVETSSNQLFITMFSDASVARRGFKAFYSSKCGGHLKAENSVGFIYSHARYGDDKYEKKLRCEWSIVARPGRGVQIRFIQFDIEKEINCFFDFVEIYDGHDRREEFFVGRFCGDQMPQAFVSSGRSLVLVFNTDDTNEYKGFVVEYSAAHPAVHKSSARSLASPSREPVINTD